MTDSPDDIKHAELDWDADGQPLSRAFGDVYFSRANGLEETRHVFLQHNQLPERFAHLSKLRLFTIGETGFGSGLNFLAAWQLWSRCAPGDARLHFISTEKYPLIKTDLARALALWPELAHLSRQLIDQYPLFASGGFHRLIFDKGRVTLTLIIGDATAGLAQVAASDHPQFAQEGAGIDAWFLDGFAPGKNPQMWSTELFKVIGQLSRSGTTAATFSAAGIVKQGLCNAGFNIKKVPGFGRKREMVSAVFAGVDDSQKEIETVPGIKKEPHLQHRHALPTPWALIRDARKPQTRTAIVVGGGLAGCHSAYALAMRGWQVTLIERQGDLAQAASGNPQGVVYAKISHKQEPLAAFNLASLQFAVRHYQPFWNKDKLFGSACGVLQLAHTAAEQKLQQRLREKFHGAQNFIHFVDAAEASRLAGIHVQQSGIFFPAAGWLNPRAICAALVAHPRIRVCCNTEALSLTRTENKWQVCARQQVLAQAAVAVVANARDAIQFAQTAHLPLKEIRGQVSYLPATSTSRNLNTVICAEGYIAPATQSSAEGLIHCTGATFDIRDADPNLRALDHQTNLDNLREHIAGLATEWTDVDVSALNGRVAFRCASPDYLPLLGPAPKTEDFNRDYAQLRKDARAGIPLAGSYWPGLYINVGHGSRGLAYTPLSAELLAAQINREPLPVSRNLMHALHPARFIIRNLQRNKP